MSSVNDPVLELRTFYELEKASRLDVIHFFMNLGLIVKDVVCHRCGKPMKLGNLYRPSVDGYLWQCKVNSKNKHMVEKSVRCGSFFNGSKLAMPSIMIITYLWTLQLPSYYIALEAKVNVNTVTEWSQFCRDVCLEICVDDSEMIGGQEVIVEMDESKFSRRKFSHSHEVKGSWIYCGVEKISKKSFFKIVEVPSKDELLAVIREFILPGTVIVSNCWVTYNCLSDDRFDKLTRCYGYQFKDAMTGSRNSSTQTVCADVKRRLSVKKMFDNNYPSYLAEYVWRKKHKDVEKEHLLHIFLEDIKKIYILDGVRRKMEELENTLDDIEPNVEVMGKLNFVCATLI